ncbi:MAG: hypothetical protein ABIH72_00110 [archaeon]
MINKEVSIEREIIKKRVTASHKFVSVLAIVSILGFIGIISETLFEFDAKMYVEALLMFIVGIGLVIEGQITRFKKIKIEGLTPTNFTHMVTVIIGFLAIIAGIFSIPYLRFENHAFLALKGILSIIAIIFIIIQTWLIE